MNYLEPNTLTWPIILEASLVKNRINLAKAEDFREKKDWDKANEFLDAFKLGFHQDKNIQGDTLSFGRPGLKKPEAQRQPTRNLAWQTNFLRKSNWIKEIPIVGISRSLPQTGRMTKRYWKNFYEG